jgi:hypothetical protein
MSDAPDFLNLRSRLLDLIREESLRHGQRGRTALRPPRWRDLADAIGASRH